MDVRNSVVFYNCNGLHDIASRFPVEVSEELVLGVRQETNVSGNDSVRYIPSDSNAVFEDVVVDFCFPFKFDECVASIVDANSVLLPPVGACLLFPKRRISEIIEIQAPNVILTRSSHVGVRLENRGKILP